MDNSNFMLKVKKATVVAVICFAIYNIVVLSVCGFSDHKAGFWLSYLFMNIAMVSITFCGIFLKNRGVEPRDWLIGYPFYRHCTIYAIIELLLSVIFMAKDYTLSWKVAFVVQIIVFAVFLVIIISCFAAKEIIEDVQHKVKVNTAFMKMLLADVQTVVEKATDADVKKAFTELADSVKYSDPVSNELLAELENRIASQVDRGNACISCGDNAGALESCKAAMLLLSERNRKCKALK